MVMMNLKNSSNQGNFFELLRFLAYHNQDIKEITLKNAPEYVKPRENPNFLKNGKMVILVKIQNFSRSQMMKQTSPLESSREI